MVPTLITQIGEFITGIPATITNFETTDTYAWLEGIFGPGLTTLVNDVQSFITNPANIAAISGGLLKIGADIADRHLGRPHRHRADALLRRIAPRRSRSR